MAQSTRPPRPRADARPGPPDAPNYWVRRAGALAVLGVIGYAAAIAIGGLFGGDEGTAQSASDSAVIDTSGAVNEQAAATPTGQGAGQDASAEIDCSLETEAALCDELGLADDVTVEEGGAAPAGDVETAHAETSEAPTVEERTGPPTPDHPAKVYIVGDSDAGTFGPYLETLLDGTLVAETELNYKVSSGLARPDFFNWPEELAAKLPEVDPDIVIVTFGGNDSQGLSLPQPELEFMVGDPVSNEAEWIEEYQRRAGEVMDLLLEDDRKVIWVGIPNDDNPDVTAALEIQDRAVKAAADERPGVVFVDTWERFSGRDGGWAEFVVDPRDNQGKDVRADDGFHLNQTGAEILAIDIAIEVQEALRELGADL